MASVEHAEFYQFKRPAIVHEFDVVRFKRLPCKGSCLVDETISRKECFATRLPRCKSGGVLS
jgi:hypothetical protein